jgi:opine dehydrogenase
MGAIENKESKMKRIAVLGAGNSGLAMAAHLTLLGERVCLWNRTEENIRELMKDGRVRITGEVQGEVILDCVTSDLGVAIRDCEWIMVTTPATAHGDIAKRLAPLIKSDQRIILHPGRTFGALEFERTLLSMGVTELPIILEAITNLYAARKVMDDEVQIHGIKQEVRFSALHPESLAEAKSALPTLLAEIFIPVKNMLYTSLGNVGMLLHCAPMLFNLGRVESETTSFRYYNEGITPSVAAYIEKMNLEVLELAEQMRIPIDPVDEWMRKTYGLSGKNLYECVQSNEVYRNIIAPKTLKTRYLLEDVPCGLVPIESLGHQFGLPMTYIGLIIDLAGAVLDQDFRASDRTLERFGITVKDLEQYR